MLRRLAAIIAIVGAFGLGSLATEVSVPAANANGCFGWNGFFVHANWCDNWGVGWYPPPPPPPVFVGGYYGPACCGCGC